MRRFLSNALPIVGQLALLTLAVGGAAAFQTLSVHWIHGSVPCSANSDPPFQVHSYDADTFIVRENKCINYEGPFIYLLFGRDTVLMQDTGAAPDDKAVPFPIRDTVQTVIAGWAKKHGGRPPRLLVTHSHAHGDHTGGDSQFIGQPNTTVVGTTIEDVRAAFGIRNWPSELATVDLGNRILDVIPIPGHEPTSIALYDRATKLLLTGDTLYPGRLYVRDWPAYKASVQRLADFVRTHEIAHVLGTHIEMSSKPGVDYPTGTTYQPDEHALALTRAQVIELYTAVERMKDAPVRETHDDFIIYPR